MKELLLLSFAFVAVTLSANAQEFDWAQTYRGTGEAVVRDIATDTSGNVYIIGDFNDSIDIDPTTNNNMVLASGANDIFFAKIDSNGAVQWIKTMGGVNNELARGITVDNNGNVILCGAFTTSMNFNPGGAPTTLSYVGVADGFVAKYDNSGNLLWVRQQGGPAEIYTNGVACDANGNVFITGHFYGTMSPNHGVTLASHTTLGQKDIFVTKFDANGFFQWSQALGGTSYDGGVAIALDNSGDPVITGYFQGTADLDPGTSTSNVTSNGNSDVFVCKLSGATGSFDWGHSAFFNSPLADEPTSIHVDANDKVYVAGYTNGQVLGLAVRYSASGMGEKFIGLAHPTFSPGNYCVIYDVKSDADNNFYVTGVMNGTIDVNADTATSQVTLFTTDDADIFVAKYDTSGAEVFMKYSSAADAQVNYGLALDNSGGIYLSGGFYGTIDCDYDVTNATIAADLGPDAHLHRLRQAAPVSVATTSKTKKMSLYPNPANNTLFLQGVEAGNTVNIYSAEGRMVKSVHITANGAVDIADISAGLYLVRVNEATGRFLKQ